MMAEVEREESAKSSDRRPTAPSDDAGDSEEKIVEPVAELEAEEILPEADMVAEIEAGADAETSKLEEEVN